MRWLWAVGVLLALLMAACGGGGEEAPSQSQRSASPARNDKGLALSCDAVQDLKSFRYTLSMRLDFPGSVLPTPESGIEELGMLLLGALQDTEIQGEFAAPNNHRMTVRIGDSRMEYVKVGDREWQRTDGGSWEEGPATIPLLDIQDVCREFAGGLEEVLADLPWEGGKQDGLAVRRYRLTDEALQAQMEDAQVNGEIWVAEETGMPIFFSLDARGRTEEGEPVAMKIMFRIKDINSKDVQIKPPR
ncbi:MAG: hypothetical protein RQ985_08640 [Dehalococcoidia bacterium]|nr:hypothetical protein [Dehalococcoidia bacterium]